ncbi:DUF3568 domain-containing protein [Francisella adeliensis]|uniref:DUF3568 domain-containing protein n=1 Tax=Francisella adeliensis TaxID=2007306 RepID=A0A2Z4Y0P6_9GAMM|nr:DUF3568 domain-containing protein [Francisella adeliensis]AXA34640.1 hypothetical protein CDH04_09630 [Francisella adeliensis]MBK2086367.1 DUF3568 domain-containing protein [Francisella adeliensis]MBK2096582.1 DUF3568 domain-containing protein [Francisella adeliensis]QIW12885.1 DUF3568 domain-containing protein [Francisella adeliensis]QIW14761.1 DUF3568 domain-containing protein [Francisella adeliensis]
MKHSKKLLSILILCLSTLGLNGCIVAALVVGGGSVAYIDGEYSMNMEGNYKDIYKAALKAVNDNNDYVLVSKSLSTDGSQSSADIDGATKIDSTSFTIKISYLTDKASKVTIKFGTFGDQAMSTELMNQIQKNAS